MEGHNLSFRSSGCWISVESTASKGNTAHCFSVIVKIQIPVVTVRVYDTTFSACVCHDRHNKVEHIIHDTWEHIYHSVFIFEQMGICFLTDSQKRAFMYSNK